MLEADPGLRDHLFSSSGNCAVELLDPDTSRAVAVLTAVADAVRTVAHPEEPTDPFVSFVGPVTATGDGASFWFDAADVEAYPEVADELLRVMVTAGNAAGATGVLRPSMPADPAPPPAGQGPPLPRHRPVPHPVDAVRKRLHWRGPPTTRAPLEVRIAMMRWVVQEATPIALSLVDQRAAVRLREMEDVLRSDYDDAMTELGRRTPIRPAVPPAEGSPLIVAVDTVEEIAEEAGALPFAAGHDPWMHARNAPRWGQSQEAVAVGSIGDALLHASLEAGGVVLPGWFGQEDADVLVGNHLLVTASGGTAVLGPPDGSDAEIEERWSRALAEAVSSCGPVDTSAVVRFAEEHGRAAAVATRAIPLGLLAVRTFIACLLTADPAAATVAALQSVDEARVLLDSL